MKSFSLSFPSSNRPCHPCRLPPSRPSLRGRFTSSAPACPSLSDFFDPSIPFTPPPPPTTTQHQPNNDHPFSPIHSTTATTRKQRRAPRIARPRDAMPGFKRARVKCVKAGRVGKGTTIGARYLDRRLSSAAYYGHGSCEEGMGDGEGDGEGGEEDVKEMFPVCGEHEVRCVVFTCKKKGRNKGRRFFKCGLANRFERCRFFAWEDEGRGMDGGAEERRKEQKEISCKSESEAGS